jgi:hypothetical protein
MTSNPPPPKAGQAQTAEPSAFAYKCAKEIDYTTPWESPRAEHWARIIDKHHSSMLASHERLKQALERISVKLFSGRAHLYFDERLVFSLKTNLQKNSPKADDLIDMGNTITTALSTAPSVNNG